ncbi:cora-like Mg2+ transporter protein-domain-containing protein [Xylariaceae sp. AK1471]|nr:cora-like Mg2+ transporter protein-domain-containing protein [Xylariaceae sp. AK1471]
MKGCAGCSDGFRKREDGIAHLSSVHFLTDSINENQSLCLRTAGQVQVEARFYTFLTLLEECTEAFKSLKKTADVLHCGTLRARDSEETKGYPVFESLVRVFEHITIILTFSCDFMVKANKVMRKNCQKALNGEKFKGQLQESLHGIVSRAKKDLEQAKVDIILSSKTDSQPGVILASIGPEFMIGVISNGLFLRQLKDTADNSISLKDSMNADNVEGRYVDAGELYKRYANKLQLQVNQRPQKRLLPDIYALEEELDILLRLNQWQQKFCQDFWRVLDPTSYRITTKARISHFRTESHYLLDTIRRLQVRYNEFHSLQKRAEKLRDQLQQSIEIEEESHGKAIRVFTFVTLFFLPLSFVTSFFGMNTTDIRNIEQDQRLFWVTSIPTTAFVIGVAYLYGYKWEGWKERSNRRRSTRYTKRIAEHGARVLRSTVAGRFFQDTAPRVDLERGGVLRRETDLSLMSIQSAKEKARRRISLWLTQKKDAK